MFLDDDRECKPPHCFIDAHTQSPLAVAALACVEWADDLDDIEEIQDKSVCASLKQVAGGSALG